MADVLLNDILRMKTRNIAYDDTWRETGINPYLTATVDGTSPLGSRRQSSLEMLDDPEPITYSWYNVNAYCQVGGATAGLHILRNVTGLCRPGELLAIMGASGAGKTTLLNVLTHRNNDNLRVTGDIFLNCRRVDPNALASLSAYVQQDDLFISLLTVREQLIFQAMLRMDRYLSYEERIKRVNQVIMELGLMKCENTLIGVPGQNKSISGGEMKRLSFACEVLTNPSLMFCDEPTSGLDSFMAQNVVAMMKSMAERGKTIISTIHQPSSEVFNIFDRILLMGEGRVAFLGSTDDALKFFSSLSLWCPKQFNPSDFFIDQLSVKPGKAQVSLHKIEQICDSFMESDHSKNIAAEVSSNQNTLQKDDASGEFTRDKSPYKASWGTQFKCVLWRSWLEIIREPILTRVRFLQVLALALLIGVLYKDQQMDEVGIFNINGALLLIISNMTFQNCNITVTTFCSQMTLFLREHHNGMYRADVFYLAKNLVQSPFFTAYAIMYTSITYFLIGLNPEIERFFLCLLVAILTAWCAISFGYLLSCAAFNINVALVIVGPCLLIFLIFSGFFIHPSSTPVFLKVIKYLSWFSYGNEVLLVNQWEGVHNLTCTGVKTCYPDGKAVLQRFGYSNSNVTKNLILLFVLIAFYHTLAFLFLLLRSRKSKPHTHSP
ncbi:protein white-like isoform X2 [Panulirus ornatus]|uniref:protein white-like isoform X2 n=1 Tax=Panulirus ornatus TaxID=150431 RepID=UPI003A85D486